MPMCGSLSSNIQHPIKRPNRLTSFLVSHLGLENLLASTSISCPFDFFLDNFKMIFFARQMAKFMTSGTSHRPH